MRDGQDNLQASVAGNANTPTDVLHDLVHRDYDYSYQQYRVKKACALNPNIGATAIKTLIHDDDNGVRACLARNKNLSDAHLDTLSRDRESWVRGQVAQNTRVHPDILHRLTQDDDWVVRRDAVSNPRTRQESLRARMASNEQNLSVIQAVANNPNAHPFDLHKIAETNLEPYRSYGTEEERKYHPEPQAVHRSVAHNKRASTETLHLLSLHDDRSVRRAVAENPNTSSETLHSLSMGDQITADCVMSHENVSSRTLQLMADSHSHSWVRGRAKEMLRRRGERAEWVGALATRAKEKYGE